MKSLEQILKQGVLMLKKNNIESAKLDSEILLSQVIGKDREFIILNQDKYLDKTLYEHFKHLVKKRSTGKPIAYLTGKKSFWNYEFKMNNETLIPRPDTELLIEEVLRLTKNRNKLSLLDIGVGSGCILLSILSEKKDYYGVGVDISKKCIELSKINAFNLGITHRVKFFKTDVDNFNYGKYDLIVSNPPYINQFDLKYLSKEVINFEPKLSLNGGLDGLSVINKVISKASKLIKLNGMLVLEIGFDQKERVKKSLRKNGFYINKVLKDYAYNDRCIISTKHNLNS